MANIVTIDLSDLGATDEIRRALKLKSPSTVSNWMARYDDFPEPVLRLACIDVYRISEVVAWATDRGLPHHRKGPRRFTAGEDRELLTLHRGGVSFAELARTHDVAVNTIKAAIRRATDSL